MWNTSHSTQKKDADLLQPGYESQVAVVLSMKQIRKATTVDV